MSAAVICFGMSQKGIRFTPWSWYSTAAICSFGGGIGAALIGSVLTGLTWSIGIELHPWLRTAGTALLIATIPLLIFSGYCLDWMESKTKKSNNQNLEYNHRDKDQQQTDEKPHSLKLLKRPAITILFVLISAVSASAFEQAGVGRVNGTAKSGSLLAAMRKAGSKPNVPSERERLPHEPVAHLERRFANIKTQPRLVWTGGSKQDRDFGKAALEA